MAFGSLSNCAGLSWDARATPRWPLPFITQPAANTRIDAITATGPGAADGAAMKRSAEVTRGREGYTRLTDARLSRPFPSQTSFRFSPSSPIVRLVLIPTHRHANEQLQPCSLPVAHSMYCRGDLLFSMDIML